MVVVARFLTPPICNSLGVEISSLPTEEVATSTPSINNDLVPELLTTAT